MGSCHHVSAKFKISNKKQRKNTDFFNFLNPKYFILDCPLLKGNQAPTQKFERPNRKIEKKFDLGQELQSSMKQFLGRFESNQNK